MAGSNPSSQAEGPIGWTESVHQIQLDEPHLSPSHNPKDEGSNSSFSQRFPRAFGHEAQSVALLTDGVRSPDHMSSDPTKRLAPRRPGRRQWDRTCTGRRDRRSLRRSACRASARVLSTSGCSIGAPWRGEGMERGCDDSRRESGEGDIRSGGCRIEPLHPCRTSVLWSRLPSWIAHPARFDQLEINRGWDGFDRPADRADLRGQDPVPVRFHRAQDVPSYRRRAIRAPT